MGKLATSVVRSLTGMLSHFQTVICQGSMAGGVPRETCVSEACNLFLELLTEVWETRARISSCLRVMTMKATALLWLTLASTLGTGALS